MIPQLLAGLEYVPCQGQQGGDSVKAVVAIPGLGRGQFARAQALDGVEYAAVHGVTVCQKQIVQRAITGEGKRGIPVAGAIPDPVRIGQLVHGAWSLSWECSAEAEAKHESLMDSVAVPAQGRKAGRRDSLGGLVVRAASHAAENRTHAVEPRNHAVRADALTVAGTHRLPMPCHARNPRRLAMTNAMNSSLFAIPISEPVSPSTRRVRNSCDPPSSVTNTSCIKFANNS